MLTGEVILAADPVNDQIPEGFVISPDPGAQQQVNTITFCVKAAPSFSNLMSGSLSGNYITVTSPSGDSHQVTLRIDPAEQSSSGNFYADPGFTEAGEWTITTHFPTIQYMDDNLDYLNLPEAWQEFSFSYTVSEASAELESPYTPIPEEAVWTGLVPGEYSGRKSGEAIIDFSGVYSSIALTDASAQAKVLNAAGSELESVTTTWQNDEHTSLRINFSMSNSLYLEFGTYYVVLPTAGTATLLNGDTEEIKDMKAGPWIIEKEKMVPDMTCTPTGAIEDSELPAYITVSVDNYGSSMLIEVADNKPGNITLTDPEGKTTEITDGTFDGAHTLIYDLSEEWYAGPGQYTFTLDCAPMSGYTQSADFSFPSEYTWTVTVLEPGVSPETPTVKIGDSLLSDTKYQFVKGSPVTIDLSSENEDAEIYYNWTPITSTQALEATDGFVKYDAPIDIEESGTLQYYAKIKNGTAQSATSSIKFTALEALSENDFTITPQAGKYTEWTATQIVFKSNDETMSFSPIRNKDVMTITDPNGGTHIIKAKYSAATKYQVTFDVTGIFEEDGTYTAVIDCDGYTFTLNDEPTIIKPIQLTYQLDTLTGVDEIGSNDSEAEYYDLNGRKVIGDLLPGIYVERKNGKVSKKIIK